MKTLMEILPSIVIAMGCMALIIGGIVYLTRRLERPVRHRCDARPQFKAFHEDEWDFMADGEVIASLVPTGPPEDPNHQFIIFAVSIVDGHAAEVEKLLYLSNDRDPEDERISYHSRTGSGVILKDSQVYLGQCGENLVRMKAYPTEEQIQTLKDRHGQPRSRKTPAPPAV